MNHLAIIKRGRIIARILLYWITFIAIYAAGGFIAGIFPGNIHFPGFGNWISGTIAAFLVTCLFLKWEKNTMASIGLVWEKGTLLRFFKGIVLGSCIFLAMILALSICGGMRLQRIPWQADDYTLIAYLIFIPLGIMEEIAFRSYSLIRLNQVFGIRVTLLITALAFALYHVSMGWSFYVAFGGPFIWSFVFGLAAIWSRGIALPAGIHISVNILQNAIGLHGNKGLFWKVVLPQNHPASIELIGLFIQFGLLAVTIIVLEIFIRRSKSLSPHPASFKKISR